MKEMLIYLDGFRFVVTALLSLSAFNHQVFVTLSSHVNFKLRRMREEGCKEV